MKTKSNSLKKSENTSVNPIYYLSTQYFLTIMDWEVLRQWEKEDKERYQKNLVSERNQVLGIIKQLIIKRKMNYNKVVLAGRISTDLTLKMTPSGVSVLKFNLATNEYYKDAQGDKKEKVSFIPCIAWKKTAEIISQFCSKGDLLMLDGKITINEYENKEGKRVKSMEVLVENPQFAPKPKVEKKEEDMPIIEDVEDLDISDEDYTCRQIWK